MLRILYVVNRVQKFNSREDFDSIVHLYEQHANVQGKPVDRAQALKNLLEYLVNTAHVDTHRFLRQCKMEDARILNENTVFCDADDVKRAASNQSIMTQAIAWLKTHNADLTHHAMPSMLDLPSYQRILADQYAYAKDMFPYN